MSEEFLQRDLINNYIKIGKNWRFYSIGSTTINQLKELGIIRSVDYGELGGKKVDGIIMEYKKVIAIVEYKLPENFDTQKKKNKAILQEIEVAKRLRTKLIIVTDGQENLWINVGTGNSVKGEKGENFKHHFDPKDPKLQETIKKILVSINESNDNILPPELVNPTDLAKKIFQDVWISSGKKPEGCLHTFVELFIFKYLSDLGILKGIFSFETLFNMYKDNEQNVVLNHYSSVIRPEIKRLFPENPLDKTTIINGTIFVSRDQKPVYSYSALFRTLLEKFNSYKKLENIDRDFKSKLFESFLKESISRKNWGQFFTPIKVVRAINEMASSELREGIKVCDPACGVGKFPLEFVKDKLNKFFCIEDGKIKQKVQIVGFDRGLEEDEQWIILAKANMLIYFCELIKDNSDLTKEFAEFFNNSFSSKNNSILGTLSEPTKNEYDLILTNPPYVVSGSSNLKNEIKRNPDLKKYYKISAMGFEGLFMEWIIRSLKEGGKAFIIIPDGILNRKNDQKLRKFILDSCYIDAIISLPEKTFFRTPKKTYVLAITKKKKNEDGIFEKQTDPVFTYLVSEIGERRDNYRFNIEQDDLSEAAILFQFFKGNKKEFYRVNNDKRCKLQEIDKFRVDIKDWSVDKWWTEEELVELGINEKINIVDLNEFSEFIEVVSDRLRKLSQLTKKIGEKRNKIIFKEVLLSDIFEIKKGSDKYNNEFINENNGEYPVYSSQTTNDGVVGKINCYDYDCECLTWTTDGIHAGTVFLRKGKFSITTHCGALIPRENKDKNLLLDYLYSYLSYNLKKWALGSQNKRITVEIIKNVKIKVPITKENEFDVKRQQEIIAKHQHVKKLKKAVEEDKQKINNLIISIEKETSLEFKKITTIGEIFDLSMSETNNSGKLTKSFIDEHQGEIPVYGASKEESSVNYGHIQDNLPSIKYFENCLTWNQNGSIGKVFFRKGRFSLSTDVIPLIVREDYKDIVDLLYLKYAMEKELAKKNFGFNNKAGKDRIKDIEITIPITPQGQFDLIRQREIARKYQQIEEIKEKVVKELEKIESVEVDIGI